MEMLLQHRKLIYIKYKMVWCQTQLFLETMKLVIELETVYVVMATQKGLQFQSYPCEILANKDQSSLYCPLAHRYNAKHLCFWKPIPSYGFFQTTI